MIDQLMALSFDELRTVYKEHLATLSISKLTQNTAAVDAFYLWRHENKQLFWKVVLDNNFEKTAKKYLSITLNRKSTGNVTTLISGYYSHLKRFRQFAFGETIILASSNSVSKKLKNTEVQIPTPCVEELEKYLEKWDKLENYHLQENALNKLFHQLCPENDKIEDVLLKCATLNDFYSTNIFSIYPVAEHIVKLNIDSRLCNGDITLVKDIQRIIIGGKERNFYSFATKYCSHHNAEEFPIYDSYVEQILVYFQKEHHFSSFKLADLKEYTVFKKALVDFRTYYGLTNYSLKQIDQYIWQLGKEYFPKKYK